MKAEIADTIKQNPGIHFREIQRETGCSSTTLNYHLKDLDFRERNIHGYRRFYPEEISRRMEEPLAALNHDVRGLILYRMKGGIPQKQLVEDMGKSKSTISTHISTLKEDGLIEEETDGRAKTLYRSKKALKALNEYGSRLVDQACEGFIDMWE